MNSKFLSIASIGLALVVAVILFVAFKSDSIKMQTKIQELSKIQEQRNRDSETIVTNEADTTQKITSKLSRKHRMLMVEINRNVTEYSVQLPEDAFLAGVLTECCSYDAFVNNADEWKNEFDVVVFNTLQSVPYQCSSTPMQIKTAIQNFMDAGVFLIWYKPSNDLIIHKYGANGSIDGAQDAEMSSLLSGLTLSGTKDFSAGTGLFQHGMNYTFGTMELIRTWNGVTAIPKNQFFCHFTSSDPNTVFPIIAVQGDVTANCTAYKPGKFFIIANGGDDENIDKSPTYKYIAGSELLRIVLGKTANVRFSQDSIYGRRIAAVGVDCDVTNETDAIKPLTNAFKGKPLELGLVASKVTDNLASWYRSLTNNTEFKISSHTYNHFNEEIRKTVTNEVHTVGTDQLITLNRPYRVIITSVKTMDNVTTFNQNGTDISTASPGTSEYALNIDTNYMTYSIDGVLKLNSSMVGKFVKITYTCDDESLANLGSLETLKAKNCLTSNAIFQTGGYYSANPVTYKLADEQDITMCAYNIYPGYNTASQIAKNGDKTPIPMGIIAKPGYNSYVCDIIFFKNSKADCKSKFFPQTLQRCSQYELPLEFYIHDFTFSATDPNSLWLSSGYDPDWKKASIVSTREYAQELYTWMVAQFDAANVYWMTRSDYVSRFNYMNKYLNYDVTEETGKITITIDNAGDKQLKGATFRIPVSGEPVSVKLGSSADCEYSYALNSVTAWCDLEPGKSETLTVTY